MSSDQDDTIGQDDVSTQEKVLGDNAGVYIPGQAPSRREVSIDFGGFIVGLYQSALVSLGKMADPITDQTDKDMDSARHTIDLIRMLEEKTRGNLDEEEAKLMKGLLYELRVAYVEATK